MIIKKFLSHLLAANALILCMFVAEVSGECLDQRSEFVLRLQEPLSGRIDGQSLRIAIDLVAEIPNQPHRHLNVWVDRKVDPDAPVSPGELGPTRYQSLVKIAEASGCVVFPVDNCLLFGRPAWVAEMADKLLSQSARINRQNESNNSSRHLIDVEWPDLTTPKEAADLILTQIPFSAPKSLVSQVRVQMRGGDLPHDLWPACRLQSVSPVTAIALVYGQFAKFRTNADAQSAFSACYRFAGLKAKLEPLVTSDPTINVRAERDGTVVTATLGVHQELCAAVLAIEPREKIANAGASEPDPLKRLQADKRTFSLTVADQKAGAVLAKLFSTGGVEFKFDASANPSLSKLVSFEAKDQTLWQLVHLIAEKSSLKIRAHEQVLLVTPEGN
ncbi:hypothetical protein [Rhodopirellula sp. MGV]|uniref:hypothetical protein n=1 Tax=Rhodopirellula sp. MGV TaxID=2023130 RepID=UPI000BD20403|nr:hypothetical protein [Rhodopirellula sp. MGV]OYP37031.1 hypothetical protein CGZ80_06675 [Rhodopirellula sp. MGV]